MKLQDLVRAGLFWQKEGKFFAVRYTESYYRKDGSKSDIYALFESKDAAEKHFERKGIEELLATHPAYAPGYYSPK